MENILFLMENSGGTEFSSPSGMEGASINERFKVEGPSESESEKQHLCFHLTPILVDFRRLLHQEQHAAKSAASNSQGYSVIPGVCYRYQYHFDYYFIFFTICNVYFLLLLLLLCYYWFRLAMLCYVAR